MIVLSMLAGLGLLACKSTGTRDRFTGDGRSSLEFALVLRPDEAPVSHTVEFAGQTIAIGPIRKFTLQEAQPTIDDLGDPAVEFTIVAREKAEFEAWTGAAVGHAALISVDREPLVVASIRSAMRGFGVLRGGGWTKAGTRELCARLAGKP